MVNTNIDIKHFKNNFLRQKHGRARDLFYMDNIRLFGLMAIPHTAWNQLLFSLCMVHTRVVWYEDMQDEVKSNVIPPPGH